jgi:ATP-dependent exoDNAse (exonuclease V) alpha subunit
VRLTVDYEGDVKHVFADPGHFEETYGERTHFPRREAVEHFAYGYCVTGHKAQGSQWDNVVICDDKMRLADTGMRKKWLYTTITRAAKKLTLYM